MVQTPVDEARYAAYRKGYEDAERGVFAPPNYGSMADRIFLTLDKLLRPARTQLSIDEKAAAYRDGHAAYGHQW